MKPICVKQLAVSTYGNDDTLYLLDEAGGIWSGYFSGDYETGK